MLYIFYSEIIKIVEEVMLEVYVKHGLLDLLSNKCEYVYRNFIYYNSIFMAVKNG